MAASRRWHVPCCGSPADTGTAAKADGSLDSSQGQGLRGGRRSEHGRPMGRSAPPSARGRPRTPGEGWNWFFRVHRHPGARTRFRAVSARERGVRATRVSRSTSSVVAVPVHCSSQKNQIRPVNEAGRAEGFIPVTPCSLGKRQPEGGAIHWKGCLFDFHLGPPQTHPTTRDLDARRGPT